MTVSDLKKLIADLPDDMVIGLVDPNFGGDFDADIDQAFVEVDTKTNKLLFPFPAGVEFYD